MAEVGVRPHAVMFPFPVHSHINPMMDLAMKLLAYDFCITFVNTEFAHARIFSDLSPNPSLLHDRIRFLQLPDGLPPSHGRLDEDIEAFGKAIDALRLPFETFMRQEILPRLPSTFSPVTCIISDLYCPWIQEVANSFSVPRIVLWTTPIHGDLLYLYQTLLMSRNHIPFQKEPHGSVIQCVPGVIPHRSSQTHSFFRADDYLFEWCLTREVTSAKEALWNLGNNICELEDAAFEIIRKQIGSFLPIGPLLPSAFFEGDGSMYEQECISRPSRWTEDLRSCQKWLDSQKPSSVLYIAFGSVVGASDTQLEELALGVEASGQPFLWAMRKKVKTQIFRDFLERTRDQGVVVEWAPQLLTLSHGSVMGFLTHCGWNSILESLSAGVPMLAMAGGFAEQNLNARYVVDEWKLGVELRSVREDGLVTKDVVEEGIRLLIAKVGEEDFMQRISEVRLLARGAAMAGGSSHANLERFVEDLRQRIKP